jgi:hypothetical protein
MKQQNHSNHTRYVPPFHFVASGLILVLLIMAIMRLCCGACSGQQCTGMMGMHDGLFELISAIVLVLLWFYTRKFSTAVQDRAIHAQESLRYFIMTGKALDPKLSWGQIIALRFASDEEYLQLMDKALKENMKPSDIKKAIKNWRADHRRA